MSGKVGSADVSRAIRAGRSGRRFWRWFWVVVALGAGGGGGWWMFGRPTAGVQYDVHNVAEGELQVIVRATGELEALTTVEVGAEVTGRLLEVMVSANDYVTSGQVLAELDKTELYASVEQSMAQVEVAQASIAERRATLAEVDLTYQRCVALTEKKVISQEQLDTALAAKLRAEAGLASAQASAVVARANLKMAQTRLGKATIVSSVNGIVLSRLVEPGQTITSGFQTPLMFKLAQDLTKMRLKVDVDEADVGRVAAGMEASFTVDAYQGRTFSSKVVKLFYEPTKSNNVVTYECELEVDNADESLRPGMTATASIMSRKVSGALLVPNTAFRFTPPTMSSGFGGPQKVQTTLEQGVQRVWVQRDGAAELESVEVRVGSTDGVMTELTSGSLTAGMRVVLDVVEQGAGAQK